MYEMLSLLKNNPLSPVFRCEELQKKGSQAHTKEANGIRRHRTKKEKRVEPRQKERWDSNDNKSLTCKAAAAAKEDAAVIDVKNLENELGLCTNKKEI